MKSRFGFFFINCSIPVHRFFLLQGNHYFDFYCQLEKSQKHLEAKQPPLNNPWIQKEIRKEESIFK
jgi:hypothetical protein